MMTAEAHPADSGGSHALYVGRVFHARLRPFSHRFSYSVFSLLLDLDGLNHLPWPLRHNRRGLLAVYDRDHGNRDGKALRPWVESQLLAGGIALPGGRIRMLCFPRVLGYVFNPITVYFCDTPDGEPAAILYEVRNTFGGLHCYALPVHRHPENGQTVEHTHAKEFYVSPFMAVEGTYRFRLRLPDTRLSLTIRYGDKEGELLIASQTGRRQELTAGNLLRACVAMPLLTVKVMAGIHWEALKLWLKGARYRPPPRTHPEAGTLRTSSTPPALMETLPR
jgi:uncharacterized protein